MKKLLLATVPALVVAFLLSIPVYATGTQTLTTAQLLAKQLCTSSCSYLGITTLQTYVGVGTPTIATSTGAGLTAGTSTLAASSTDLAGSITINTGNAPVASSTIFSFTSASSTASFCVLQPVGTTTASLYGATSTIMQVASSTVFNLRSNVNPLIGTTTYQWNYECN